MKRVRIGIVGAGANTRSRHLPGFQAIDGVEVVCVTNRTKNPRIVWLRSSACRARTPPLARIDRRPRRRCCVHWYLAQSACGGNLRGTGGRKACAVRSPYGPQCGRARQMLTAADKTDRVTMLVPSPFGLAGDRLVRKLVASGFLGELRELYIRGLTPAPADPTIPLHWRGCRSFRRQHSGAWHFE